MRLWQNLRFLIQSLYRANQPDTESISTTAVSPSPTHLTLLRQGATVWNEWRVRESNAIPDLKNADLHGEDLKSYNFSNALLQQADLRDTLLCGSNLRHAHLEGANLSRARLVSKPGEAVSIPANLQGAYFDQSTNLEGVILGDGKKYAVPLADIHWNEANLTVVNWKLLPDTGEGKLAERHKTRLRYLNAARSDHQLAVALESQGLAEEAVPYAYKARILQRQALILQVLHRPSEERHQHWIIHMLQLRGRKLRTWRIFAIFIPITLIIISLLIFFGNHLPVLQWVFGLLLGFLFLSWVFILLSPLNKLVLLLVSITGLPPFFVFFLFAALMNYLASIIQQYLPSESLVSSLSSLFASLLTVAGTIVSYEFFNRLVQNFEQLRQRLKDLYLGYRSLYPLLMRTLGDYGKIMFSSFLDMLAGYGYKPGKAVRNYLVIIVIFALLSWFVGNVEGAQAAIVATRQLHKPVAPIPVFSPLGALMYSIISFHGRGLFPSVGARPDDLLVVIAAIEAIIGLIIEVSFIATFTQRFLSR